jgi:hypothetical protein
LKKVSVWHEIYVIKICSFYFKRLAALRPVNGIRRIGMNAMGEYEHWLERRIAKDQLEYMYPTVALSDYLRFLPYQ